MFSSSPSDKFSASQHDSLHQGIPLPAIRAVRTWPMEGVCKRDGRIVPFDQERIVNAIFRAAKSVGGNDKEESWRVSDLACEQIAGSGKRFPTVEEVQDIVERVLIMEGHATTAKAYILYRAKRAELRYAAAEAGKQNDRERQGLFEMFAYKGKLVSIIGYDRIEAYKNLLFLLKDLQAQGKVPTHPEGNYLNNNELASTIFQKKYYLKDLRDQPLEKRPEDLFARLAAFMAAVEPDEKRAQIWAEEFYRSLYEGYFVPGGRVIAGAGDLYRLKTLANCFVSLLKEDNLEAIYQAAYECARTYSYGGGIGVDISALRPAGALVHNAASHSTGAVSFMELYSLTTGLIGQAGRRGALMITLDIKHPDAPTFARIKKVSNWTTKQIAEQARMSGKFSDIQVEEIERQVRENTQVRHANISLKMSDEFMRAVEEQNEYGPDTILIYEKDKSVSSLGVAQGGEVNYSYGIPSKPIERYTLQGSFSSISELNAFLAERGCQTVMPATLADETKRDMFGDLIIPMYGAPHDFAIKYAGDFMLYFNSQETGEVKRLIKARELWDAFVEGNYRTAEPGLIFWTRMTRFSPSNYVGRPIASTNPCGEIPLEDGGACNLGSINLSRFVRGGYTGEATIDWDGIAKTSTVITRFLDNVVTWNETLNALEKQRKAARETRRLGIGVMGIADMLNQLGLAYDSDEGIRIMEEVMRFVANAVYRASADLAEEKGPSPIFDYEPYARGEFFQQSLTEETREIVRQKGLRNVALLSIAPTGTISNIPLSYKIGDKHFIGVSGGIEPIFALYYTRRSESFGNQMFKMFHSTVDAYIQEHNLTEQVKEAKNLEDLKAILPAYFFRTAHTIAPDKRVAIQGVCQQYIDHSISSTVNLAEDIEPEVISNIYLDAWRKGLKGITIYREGSRFAILTVEGAKNELQDWKGKTFSWDGKALRGDDVISLPNGRLTTVYHAVRGGFMRIEEGGILQLTEAATKREVAALVDDERDADIRSWREREQQRGSSEVYDDEVLPSTPSNERVFSVPSIPRMNTAFVPHAASKTRVASWAVPESARGQMQTSFAKASVDHQQMISIPGARLMECPACNQHTLKMESGCNTCINEECGYGQCEA